VISFGQNIAYIRQELLGLHNRDHFLMPVYVIDA
jgi:hypothetical protein